MVGNGDVVPMYVVDFIFNCLTKRLFEKCELKSKEKSNEKFAVDFERFDYNV